MTEKRFAELAVKIWRVKQRIAKYTAAKQAQRLTAAKQKLYDLLCELHHA
jgi:hypothetical protein